ncbi:unnamed protein product [Gadus morhua 'NCC']
MEITGALSPSVPSEAALRVATLHQEEEMTCSCCKKHGSGALSQSGAPDCEGPRLWGPQTVRAPECKDPRLWGPQTVWGPHSLGPPQSEVLTLWGPHSLRPFIDARSDGPRARSPAWLRWGWGAPGSQCTEQMGIPQ